MENQMQNQVNSLKICQRRRLRGWGEMGGIVIFFWLWMIPYSALTQQPPERQPFFREGYQQLQQEIQRLEQPSTEPKQGVLTIETDQLKWQQFLSRQGGFSIWIPIGNSTTETKSVTTTSGILTFEVWISNQPNSRFLVAYATLTANLSTEQTEFLFDQIRDSHITDTTLTIQSVQPISLEQFPGERVVLKNTAEETILQMYRIEDRIYLLGTTKPHTMEYSTATDQFFDSFRLLP
ncbi:MAG: hypothetical protein WBA13_13755 [Microcoleaceae cyanobacterium]